MESLSQKLQTRLKGIANVGKNTPVLFPVYAGSNCSTQTKSIFMHLILWLLLFSSSIWWWEFFFFLSHICYNVCRWLSCGTEWNSQWSRTFVCGWILLGTCCARFLYVILQVGNQGVTPPVFVPAFSNMFLYGPALGRFNQADQEPVAELCCWYGPSEKLLSLC